MATWDSLIRFQASGGKEYWAALPLETTPATGMSVQGYLTIEDLESGSGGVDVTVERVHSLDILARRSVCADP
jgi:hypothetical protein